MKNGLVLLFAVAGFSVASAQPQLTPVQQQATDLFKAGKPDEAIPLFKKAIAENGKDGYSINALDIIYFRAGRYAEVYDMAGKGIAATGGAIPFVSMKAKAAWQLKKYPEAIALADNYNKVHTPDAQLLYVKGKSLEATGDAQGAITAYSAAIAADGNYAESYLARGNYFNGLGRLAPAIRDYDKYISLAPDDAEGYDMRGIANYKNGDQAAAIADYTKAIALKPDYAQALANRGMANRDKGETAAAVADFDAAIKLTPNDGSFYFEEAVAYDHAKDFAKALPLINKAISLQPGRNVYYAEQCSILLKSDRNSEALAAAETAIRLAPKVAEGYLMKSMALYNLEKWDDALTTATTGIAQDGAYYMLYMQRAAVYRAKGNAQAADADDAKAKELAAK